VLREEVLEGYDFDIGQAVHGFAAGASGGEDEHPRGYFVATVEDPTPARVL
jgi:hypothetical protein